MEKKKFDVTTITFNALVAATYVVLTYASTPIAFGAIQFRIAEIMMLLPFFNKKYAIGLTLGCLIANLMSPFMVLDIIFGTLATLVSCIGVMFCKQLWMAALIPVICNAFIVAGVLTTIGEPYWMSVLTVGAGELAVLTVGYIIFMLLRKNTFFFKSIKTNQNLDFKC
ncbi:MAG: QueT transporter family protein [Bacilli bacterium]|nr:QueT transporter family protein [Bacilli bacterium]